MNVRELKKIINSIPDSEDENLVMIQTYFDQQLSCGMLVELACEDGYSLPKEKIFVERGPSAAYKEMLGPWKPTTILWAMDVKLEDK